MKQELILIKVGEIALKGLNRRTFEDVLMKNIKRHLAPLGKFEVRSAQSTIYVRPLEAVSYTHLDVYKRQAYPTDEVFWKTLGR